MISITGTTGAGELVGAQRSLQKTPLAMLRRAALATWTSAESSRQRHALAELDNHLLRDIGLTRSDIRMEIRKPFWRV
jgi:uncharacterized protein YjiS (DUF1127 family)